MLTLNVKAKLPGSAPVMVKVVGISSLVASVRLFTVGGWVGTVGSVGLLLLEEQVQMNRKVKLLMSKSTNFLNSPCGLFLSKAMVAGLISYDVYPSI